MCVDCLIRLVDCYASYFGTLTCVAWSPDGTRIVSGSYDRSIQIWNAATGEHISSYQGHSDEVRTVAWSKDGTRIVSGSADKTAQVWWPG